MKHEKKTKTFLCIDSYVYVNIKKESAIIYNTFSHEIIQTKSLSILKILRRLKDNLLITRLKQSELDNNDVQNFIKDLQTSFSGFIFENLNSKQKPIQLYPQLIVGRKYPLYKPRLAS